MSNIGEILRNNRESNNLTLKQLAEISGVGPSTISDIENGKAKHPRMDTLEKLASAFQISVNDFFDNKADSDKKLNNKKDSCILLKQIRVFILFNNHSIRNWCFRIFFVNTIIEEFSIEMI